MKNFMKILLSSSNEVSSKRLAGLVGWFVFTILVSCMVIFRISIGPTISDALNTLAFLSASLLGLSTFTEIFNKDGKNNK